MQIQLTSEGRRVYDVSQMWQMTHIFSLKNHYPLFSISRENIFFIARSKLHYISFPTVRNRGKRTL